MIFGEEAPILEDLLRANGRPSTSSDEASEALPSQGTEGAPASLDLKTAARGAVREAERDVIVTALKRTQWNRTQAARLLGVSYKTLLTKMKDLLPPGA